jgi:large subunit ribosomal protein L30
MKKVQKTKKGKCLIAIRLRGTAGLKSEFEKTLVSLRLTKKFRAAILYDRPEITGMLAKVKDLITWGEARKETLRLLLKERAQTIGGKKLANSFVKQKFGLATIERLASAIDKGELPLKKLWKEGLNPNFRLHPPKGGFKGKTKLAFKQGGELGYRGEAIYDLIARMV